MAADNVADQGFVMNFRSELPNQLAGFVPALRDSDDEFRLRLLLHDFAMVWWHACEHSGEAAVHAR